MDGTIYGGKGKIVVLWCGKIKSRTDWKVKLVQFEGLLLVGCLVYQELRDDKESSRVCKYTVEKE